MFNFERDVSRKLIAVSRRHLPDHEKISALLFFLKDKENLLRSVVLAMVRRGDFNIAVRQLTDLLMQVAAEYRFEFQDMRSPSDHLSIDSVIVIVVALLSAFTQQMVDLKYIPESAVNKVDPYFHPFCSLYTWTAVSRVPPLERSVATDLLTFSIRIMPRDFAMPHMLTPEAMDPRAKLADVLMSMSQYVYMSNPAVVQEFMASALAEWEAPAVVELALLSPVDSSALEVYMKLIRAYLARLDSAGQQRLFKIANFSILRGIIMRPTCLWATGPAANAVIKSFAAFIEKSRLFRALRAFKKDEAEAITMMEILQNAGTIYHPTSPSTSAASPHTSTVAQKSSLLRKGSSHPVESTPFSMTPTTSPSTIADSESHHHGKVELISVAHTRTFERAVALARRDNPTDKRATSRLAAIEYIAYIGSVGWLLSERPEGEPFFGIVLDVAPHIPLVVDDFPNISQEAQMMFGALCAHLYPTDFERISLKMSPRLVFDTLQFVRVTAKPTHFSVTLRRNLGEFTKFLRNALHSSEYHTIFAGLDTLLVLDSQPWNVPVFSDMVFHLTQYMASGTELGSSFSKILEHYVMRLVGKIHTKDLDVNVISPLLLSVKPIHIFGSPKKLQVFHHFLCILSRDHVLVPAHYLEGKGILAEKTHSIRNVLLVSLCSDNRPTVKISLKCLELMQSDPEQSRAERDLVSELLDSVDQTVPSTNEMQRRMAALIAMDPDLSFLGFNELVRKTLKDFKASPLSEKIHVNLLRMRTATLSLEPQEVREMFYSDILPLDGDLLTSVSGSVPLSSNLAHEFLSAIISIDRSKGPTNAPVEGSRLAGKCSLYTWLIKCLETENMEPALDLRLADICAAALSKLGDDNTPSHEVAALKLLETSAEYMSKIRREESTSGLFEEAIDLVLERKWNPQTLDAMGHALGSVLKHFVEPGKYKMEKLIEQISRLDKDTVQITLLTSLLHGNFEDVMRYYDNLKKMGGVYRASVYEALSIRYFSKTPETEKIEKTGDFVVFLLENKPVITALSDVCSLNGDDGLSSALVQLFLSHSASAERKLISLAISHEISCATSVADVFRGNSVTMKVLLEWLRTVSASYLRDLLSPTLRSLRSASIRDGADMENLFTEAASRFKNRTIPVYLRWLISLVMEIAGSKYGEEAAKHSLGTLLILRFVCPAVVAPHSYGISKRPPARQFATLLRKFAIYLQHNGGLVLDYMTYSDPRKASSSSNPSFMNVNNSKDFEQIFAKMDTMTGANNADVNEQYTSASRKVYHFLRRHAVEVRVVLLSHGHGEIVAKMLRFFRLGRLSDPNSFKEPVGTHKQKERGIFKGQEVIAVSARSLTMVYGSPAKHLLKDFGSHSVPTVIDFTDFIGLFDFWAEFMLYMAYTVMKDIPETYQFHAINCPKRGKGVISRLKELISHPVRISFSTSLDYRESLEELPQNLPDAISAVADIKDAVKFNVQVRPGTTGSLYEANLFIGSKYLQIVSKDLECDVIPYVSSTGSDQPLTITMNPNELRISLEGSEFTIYRPSSTLLRILSLSLSASGAQDSGTIVDFDDQSSSDDNGERALVSKSSTPNLVDKLGVPAKSADCDSSMCRLKPSVQAPYAPSSDKDVHGGCICPGKLLFSALLDSLSESPEVRRRAIDLYTLLPDSFGLQLSVPSPQQMLLPNQVFSLAVMAAKRHPELATCVVSALADEGVKINEQAAKIAAPWVPHLDYEQRSHRTLLRSVVLEPLLQAVSDAPDAVGPPLLEHFWPALRGMPTLMADILLNISVNASTESLEALRQILTSGISPERPYESREFAEALLARLYSDLRGTGDPSATLWSQHPDWKEINVCAVLFGSITVDWRTAEELLPDVFFLLLILVGVGTPQLRNSLYQLLTNYLNAFIQSPKVFAAQRHTLRFLRSELSGPRGLALFGVQTEVSEDSQAWVSDDFTEHTPEMSEHLGWLMSDIITAAFANRLAMHQETRVAIASRVVEHTDITWPPLQRRCILGLIGSVRFLMPEAIVADLLNKLGETLAEKREGSLTTRGVLVSSFLRMFSETLECIPDTGFFQEYLFWLAVAALATGCIAIQLDAMRLLRESIKIGHFRGMFRERSVSEVYLKAIPPCFNLQNTAHTIPNLPLDIPTTKSNFHIALAQLLVTSLQTTESQNMALDCCDVLATACPQEFVYPVFLYLGGEEARIAARVPTGALVDGDDAVIQWLASRVKPENTSSILALALCAEICGFSRSMTFSQTGPRMLDLMVAVKNRHVVNVISPLLRRIFLRLLELGEEHLELAIAKWSTYIFSRSPEERRAIDERRELPILVESLGMRPWFDENCQIQPLFYENDFTESSRHALEERRWFMALSNVDHLSNQAEKLF